MILVFALDRDVSGDWWVGHHAACRGQALSEVATAGGTLGVPTSAIEAIAAKLRQEESVGRIKGAAVETGTRVVESILDRIPALLFRKATSNGDSG